MKLQKVFFIINKCIIDTLFLFLEEEKEREAKKDHENKLEKVHKKIIDLPSDQNRVTLKASDVYTDDSSNDSDLNESVKERHNIKHSNTNIRNMATE